MMIDSGGPSHSKGSIKPSVSGSRSPVAAYAAPASAPAMAKPANAPSDSVSLSAQAQSLAKLEGKINQAPDTDRQKVDAIKQAIAEGKYKIDPHKIAAALLAEEQPSR